MKRVMIISRGFRGFRGFPENVDSPWLSELICCRTLAVVVSEPAEIKTIMALPGPWIHPQPYPDLPSLTQHIVRKPPEPPETPGISL